MGPFRNTTTVHWLRRKGGELLDFRTDATRLPFRANTIGALFVSCLTYTSRLEAFFEAKRVLEPGGLFIVQGAFDDDVLLARAMDFELVQYHKRKEKIYDLYPSDPTLQEFQRLNGKYVWNIILRKPDYPSPDTPSA